MYHIGLRSEQKAYTVCKSVLEAQHAAEILTGRLNTKETILQFILTAVAVVVKDFNPAVHA